MVDKKPVLSFAIPTWNRYKEIQECLDSMIKQIIEANRNVEIFISDNASTDETPKVLEEYAKKYKFIKYSRNEKNLGWDLNFISAIEKSTGEYTWLFGDDDILADGALKEILSIIEQYRPDYISTNVYWWMEINGERKIIKNNIQSKYMSKISKNIDHIDFEELLNLRNIWFTFISSNIFLKNSLDLQIIKKEVNKLSTWSHIKMTAQALSNGNGFITSKYCVAERMGNVRANELVFLKLLPDAFEYIFSEFKVGKPTEKEIYNGIRKTWLSFKSLMIQKVKKGKHLYEDISPKIVPLYYRFFSPIIPTKLIIVAYKFKRFLNGKGFSLPKEA